MLTTRTLGKNFNSYKIRGIVSKMKNKNTKKSRMCNKVKIYSDVGRILRYPLHVQRKSHIHSISFSKYLVIWAYILDKRQNCQVVSIMSVITRLYFNDCHWQGMFLPFLHDFCGPTNPSQIQMECVHDKNNSTLISVTSYKNLQSYVEDYVYVCLLQYV